ncbi:MAG: amino acid ABC transporter substrate-binding protein [Thermoleophilia bacterium]
MTSTRYKGRFGLVVLLLVAVAGLLVFTGCASDDTTTTTAATTATTAGGSETTDTTMAPPEQDKIVIGAARPVSGGLSVFEGNNFGPAYKLWVEDVNAAGGINVGGKMLPIEMKVYDDQSDLDTSMRLLSKLMEEDKVDFVLAPASTAFLFAAAGVANANEYIMMSAEGGATTLEKELRKGTLPYFFQGLNYSNHEQMPAFAEILKEVGAKTVAVVYLDDLHGIEYQAQAAVFLSGAGIDIVQNIAIPGDIKDMTSIIKQIQADDPDVVAFFAYPPQNILAMQTMMQLNYSPRGVLIGPGGASQWFATMFGDAIEGIMFEGAWSVNSSPEAKAYYDRLGEFMGSTENVDHWGAIIYRAQLEFFQQAIEEAGTLDQAKIAEVMRTAHYKTTMSPDTFFTDQIFDPSSYAGQIGQWQSGVAEVIDVGDKRTAAPIYPKPAWPAAQ